MKKLLMVGILFAGQMSCASEGISTANSFDLQASLKKSKKYKHLENIKGFGYNLKKDDPCRTRYSSISEIILNSESLHYTVQGYQLLKTMKSPVCDKDGYFLESDLPKNFTDLVDKQSWFPNRAAQAKVKEALTLQAAGYTPVASSVVMPLAFMLSGMALKQSSDSMFQNMGNVLIVSQVPNLISSLIFDSHTMFSNQISGGGSIAYNVSAQFLNCHPLSAAMPGVLGLTSLIYAHNKKPLYEQNSCDSFQDGSLHHSNRNSPVTVTSLKTRRYNDQTNKYEEVIKKAFDPSTLKMRWDKENKKVVPYSSSEE